MSSANHSLIFTGWNSYFIYHIPHLYLTESLLCADCMSVFSLDGNILQGISYAPLVIPCLGWGGREYMNDKTGAWANNTTRGTWDSASERLHYICADKVFETKSDFICHDSVWYIFFSKSNWIWSHPTSISVILKDLYSSSSLFYHPKSQLPGGRHFFYVSNWGW